MPTSPPGANFRSAVRRGIFVEPQAKISFSPVGVTPSVHTPADVASDETLAVGEWRCYKYINPDGLGKIRGYRCPAGVENSNALCPVRPPKTAFGPANKDPARQFSPAGGVRLPAAA
jgi:hypothetical protein